MKPSHGLTPAGFRLPDRSQVGAVRLQVGDLDRSIAFYQEVIGLRLLARTDDVASLGASDDEPALLWLQAHDGARPVPRRGRFGLFHFAILLPDRAALGRAADHLLRRGVLTGAADHHVSEALYLSDPDGLGIEIYADRPSSQWKYRDRELQMTTEPLDLDALARAAGGVRWGGAPTGTTIGHVHLHVGNLEQAAAFYHSALGFDQTMWSYPGALFFSAGGYHHHLGTNTWSPGPSSAADEAQLLEWELVVPDDDGAAAAADSVRGAGFSATPTSAGWMATDPWGTRVRIRGERQADAARVRHDAG